jgi:ABC-2 type transport system permease protein
LAEEKKNGTIELLLTYPIRELAVVLGKYLATLLVIVILLALTAINIFMISRFGVVEWGPVLTGYGGLILLAAGFVSLGLFASALTQNQIIAAVLGFGALLMFWVIGWAGSVSGPGVGKVVNYLSLLDHRDSGYPGYYVLPDFFGIFYFFDLALSGFAEDQRMRPLWISDFGIRIAE